MSAFRCEEGISTVSCAAWMALRTRVRKSETGSVIDMGLPAGLGHPGDEPVVGELAQTDAAQTETAVDRSRPATALTPGVVAGLELLGACLAHALRGLGHRSLLLLARFLVRALG